MDEISHEPKRDFRLPAPPWLTRRRLGLAATVVAALVFAIAVVTRSGGHHAGAGARVPAATATLGLAGAPLGPASAASLPDQAASPPRRSAAGLPDPVPGPPLQQAAGVPYPVPGPPPYPLVPARGTSLIGCDSAVSGLLAPHWRASSLGVGPLWFVNARHLGYVRVGRGPGAGRTPAARTAPDRDVEVLVHVDPGQAVALRAAAGTWPYFKFLDAQADAQARRYPPPAVGGFTFIPCPRAGTGPADAIGFYQFDFSIAPGYSAAVEVLTSSGRDTWLTFTAGAAALPSR